MLDVAIRRMEHIDLIAAAEKSGLSCDAQCITITTFGEQVTIDTASCLIHPTIDMWQHLAILQYLETANGGMPTDTWISIADLRERGLAFTRHQF